MAKQEEIYIRIHDEAQYIIENKCTIRECAKAIGTTKSTVHKDMKYRLPEISKGLHNEVYRILKQNERERHIRGGESTRKLRATIHENRIN